MKNLISILLLAGIFISFSGCKTSEKINKKNPASVSEYFFMYLRNQEYDKARELASDETKKIINVIQTLSEFGGGINILSDNKKELLNCEINGNEAVCRYRTFSGGEQNVYLIRVKGKWLVDLRREEQNKK